MTFVTPEGIEGIEPGKRHGPILCARIFELFQVVIEGPLSHLLRSWQPEYLAFQETAFAILCLASGSQNVSLEAASTVQEREADGFVELKSQMKDGKGSEFVASLGSGCHFEGDPPGSAPSSSIFWFENTLIYFIAQLDRPDAVAESIVQIINYCQERSIVGRIHAVLISIEHVVLAKILEGQIERTEPLPLFQFVVQPCLHPRFRYSDATPARMRRRVKRAVNAGEVHPRSVGSTDVFRYGCCVTTDSSFLALAHFLESAQRQDMPSHTQIEHHFPMEVCEHLSDYLDDVVGRRACMRVSKSFRDRCQETVKFNDDLVILANPETMTYHQASEHRVDCRPENITRAIGPKVRWSMPPALRTSQTSTGKVEDLVLVNVEDPRPPGKRLEDTWRITIGNDRDRRSILPGLELGFLPRIQES